MSLWTLKAARTIILLAAVAVIGFLTFDKILKKVESEKPPINTIPEEIKSAHFISSYPEHNQFLATVSPSVVINFDKEPTSTKALMYINGKERKPSQRNTAGSLVIPQAIEKTANVEDGIYLIKYQACFGADDCTEGQFVYHIDSFRGQKFANLTAKLTVEILIKDTSSPHNNIVVDDHTDITWNNQTDGTIEIKSAPLNFNNAYEPLNSGEIKKGESFKLELPNRGEYLWYLKSNPKVSGKILVV